jgi:hypothetical protein
MYYFVARDDFVVVVRRFALLPVPGITTKPQTCAGLL